MIRKSFMRFAPKGWGDMGKRWWLVIMGFFVMVAIPAFWYVHAEISVKQSPRSGGGVMELSGADSSRDGIVALRGEWEFYRGQLLAPEQFAASPPANGQPPVLSGMVEVPGRWNAYIADDGRPASTGTGYGTFRLRLRLAAGHEGVYGIRTTNIRMANKVFINGQEVGASGTPGPSPEGSVPYNAPYVGFAYVGGDEVDIIVHVANFSYSSGGMIYPMLFGDQQAITRNRERAMFGDYFSIAGFTLFFIFLLILHRMRRQEYALLYLGFFCLVTLVYTLTHGEKLIAAIAPGLSYETVLKMQNVSAVFIVYFLIRYADVLVPHAIHRVFMRACDALGVASLIMAVSVPALVYSRLFPWLLLTTSVCVCGTLYMMFKGIKDRSGSMVFILLSVMSVLCIMAANAMHVQGVLRDQLLISYETLIFVVLQLAVLARRFARSFHEIEVLSRKLLTLDGLKDEFMANTSHELRTPLHGIINIAESLLGGVAGGLNREQVRQMSMIVSTGKRLSYLIHDILDFAKLKNGDVILHRRAVHLPSVAQSVLEVVGHLSRKKGVDLIQRWPEHLPLLDADENRLQQILYNLLGNAVKFTETGEIRVYAEAGAGMVTVCVADTGTGIERERLDDIFKPFLAAASPAHAPYAGTGIGLSITKKLVELGGGHLEVESNPGSGSVFRFTVPVAAEASAPIVRAAAEQAAVVTPTGKPPLASSGGGRAHALSSEGRAHAPSGEKPPPAPPGGESLSATAGDRNGAAFNAAADPEAGSRFRVIVVDDDPVNLQVLVNLLSVERYTVIPVDNGAEALRALRGDRGIDLVITDWMMPGMSGLDLCRRIRERYGLSELPILLLTARSLAEDVQAGLLAGANDFLSKPVDAAVLQARVRTLLELRKSLQSAIRSELGFLQAQIKPHFLYNALNTIISVCPTDPEKATQLMMDLSRYLRSSFDFDNPSQLVTLEKELELVHSYAALELARFGKRLRIAYEVDDHLQAWVPPLSIQPIVENAVRHGVMQKPQGGTVVLKIEGMAGKIAVSVKDDGVGMKPQKVDALLLRRPQRKGVGLVNIHYRLLALYGIGLSVTSEWGGGTTVSFDVFPLPPS